MLLGSVGLGLFVAALDTYVVVTLLPRMITDLDLPIEHVERATPVITGFLLGYIVAMPLLGAVSDAYGRGRVYLLSLAVFCVGSVLTATAGAVSVPFSDALGIDQSAIGLPWLVAGRVLQGLGGGALVPVALALAADLYPAGRRVAPLGLVAALQESGSVLGPLYGAALAGAAAGLGGWRAVFWVNLPLALVCAAAFILVGRRETVDATETGPPATVDWWGGVLLGLGLGLLVIALYPDNPATRPVSATFAPAGVAAVIVVAMFLRRQARTLRPLVPPALLRSRAFIGASATNLLVGAGLMVALVDVPILARGVFGLDQLGAALLLARFMVAIPVGALLGGWLGSRAGYRLTALAGLVATSLAFMLMSGWQADELTRHVAGLPDADLTLAVLGLGFGLVIAPVAAAALDQAEAAEHGLASSLVVVARTSGMLLGLSALTALGLHRFYELIARAPTPPAGASLAAQQAALEANVVAALLAEYHEIFVVAAAVSAVAALVALAALGGRPGREKGHG